MTPTYDTCHEEVSRRGEAQPCDIPAVALRHDPEHGIPYPVCVRHTRHPMVLLRDAITGNPTTVRHPAAPERIVYDGPDLDEIVLDGRAHLEALDPAGHTWMLILHRDQDAYIHLEVSNASVIDHAGLGDLIQVREPLLGCGHTWAGANAGVNHRCGHNLGHDGEHTCSCNAKERTP